MGSLIMTKGTKRLAAHYNDEFDTWLTFYKTTALHYFNRGGGNIDIWNDIIQKVTDGTAGHSKRPPVDQLTLLPKDDLISHAHLHARWKFFLQNVLLTKQNDLVDAIYAALQTNCAYILFDVVAQGPVPPPPYVTLVYGNDAGSPIAKITIVVAAAMSKGGPGGHNPDTID
jgi:hypothetical protein